MTSRTARDLRAHSTHVAAMKIIEAENARRRLKTAHLRALRLASEAKAGTADRLAEEAQNRPAWRY
jgi:hypothetical protein